MDTEDINPLDEGGATVPVREFRAGQKVFHRYTLKKELGRGGMGVVWLAHDDKLEQEVALKFLPESVRLDPSAVDELKRETRRSLKLTHPNIVRIHDFVDDETTAGISMEFVDGSTLAGLRSKQPQKIFSPAELAPLIRQLCAALDYAHNDAKVIHRDLKPSNLMVTSKRQIKVADFGIARSVSDSMSRVTANQGTSGTLVYISPQQLAGIPSKPTDDVYALGATIFELLAGRPPFFSGDIPYQIREVKPPTMAERRGELDIEAEPLPEQWEEVIALCLAKDPAQRPQSAGAVAAGLSLAPPTDLFTASTPPLTTPKSDYFATPHPTATHGPATPQPTRPPTASQRTQRLDPTAPPIIPVPEPPTPVSKTQTVPTIEPPKKSPIGLIIAGVLGILLLMGAVWYFASRPKQQQASINPVPPATNTAQQGVVEQDKLAEETKELQKKTKELEDERQKIAQEAKEAEASRLKKEADALAEAERLKNAQVQSNLDDQVKQHGALEQKRLAEQEAQTKADAEAKSRLEAEAKLHVTPAVPSVPQTLAVPGNYPTIARALLAAKSGDTIQVKSGIYNESLQLKEGIKLIGEGMGNTTVRCPATAGTVLSAHGCGSGYVSGFTFEHTGSDPSPNRGGVVGLFDSNIEMDHCVIRNSGGHGLVIRGGWNTVHDCTCSANGWDGIFVGSKASPTLQDNKIEDNLINGISFQGGSTGVAERNISQHNQDDGIYISNPGTSPVLKTNKCIGNAKLGIGINDHASAVAEGNTCQDNTWSGIAVLSSATATLSGNQCIKNRQNGIEYGGGSNGRAEHNNCLQNGANGILLEGSATSVRVISNQCNFNFQYGIRLDPGTPSEIDIHNLATGNKLGQIQKE